MAGERKDVHNILFSMAGRESFFRGRHIAISSIYISVKGGGKFCQRDGYKTEKVAYSELR